MKDLRTIDMIQRTWPKPALIDVTLRDGGFRTRFGWTVHEIITIAAATLRAGSDRVELGYIGGVPELHHVQEGGVSANLTPDLISQVASTCGGGALCAMVHPSACHNTIPFDAFREAGLGMIRIVYHPSWDDRFKRLALQARDAGLTVAGNVALASRYRHDELVEVAASIIACVDIVYLADTCGAMIPSEVAALVARLAPITDVGFHGHDYLSMGLANTYAAAMAGAKWVDASVAGIGRGAGNLRLELWMALSQAHTGDADLSEILAALQVVRSRLGTPTTPDLVALVCGALNLTPPQEDELRSLATRAECQEQIAAQLLGRATTGDSVSSALESTDQDQGVSPFRFSEEQKPTGDVFGPRASGVDLRTFDATFISRFFPKDTLDSSLAVANAAWFRYAPTQGDPTLRAFIADRISLSPDEILITDGASQGLLLTILTLLRSGDTIYLPQPVFPAYTRMAAMRDCNIVFYNHDQSEDLHDKLTRHNGRRKGVAIINSPHNPTGLTFDTARLAEMIELASKRGVLTILDETYQWLAGDTEQFAKLPKIPTTSLGPAGPPVAVSSLGKFLCLPGLRLGFVATENAGLLRSMTETKRHLAHASCHASEQLCLSLLRSEAWQLGRVNLASAIQSRRETFERLTTPLGVDILSPAVGFYVYANRVKILSDHQVIGVPGVVFEAGEDEARYCLAASDRDWRKLTEVFSHDNRTDALH